MKFLEVKMCMESRGYMFLVIVIVGIVRKLGFCFWMKKVFFSS